MYDIAYIYIEGEDNYVARESFLECKITGMECKAAYWRAPVLSSANENQW
jgi:hypothetical protein